jgi:hypothetical protein
LCFPWSSNLFSIAGVDIWRGPPFRPAVQHPSDQQQPYGDSSSFFGEYRCSRIGSFHLIFRCTSTGRK